MRVNEGYSYREIVDSRAEGETVLDWLAARHAHSSRATWRARIEGGEVLVDESAAAFDHRLRRGEALVWNRPPWHEPDVPLRFDVLHADAHVLAVAKPSGLPTQPAGGFLAHTLQAIVQRQFPGSTPLHRLGRGTSGIVLFARTDAARRSLAAAFREGRVEKIYRTLVTGAPAWDERAIDTPIGPVAHAMLGTVHAASSAGRPARSHARVVERRDGQTLLDVSIETGRPHQIRIHMAAVGHPLAGDPLYLPGGVPAPDALPGDEGYLLHAMRVAFEHPAGGTCRVQAPLPPPLVVAAGPGGS